jgi:hypothetical protein
VRDDDPHAGPEAMREVVREYVRAVHQTYLDHVRQLPPAEHAALPLLDAAGLTVVAAAGRRLHLVATTDRLPPPRGQEVELSDEHNGTQWIVRFYDPSVLPDLGLLAEDSPDAVRQALGIGNTVYHLTVDVGGGLTAHHAQHSGVALANQHTHSARDLARLRRAYPGLVPLVDELRVCARIGLDRAAALLTAELTSGRVRPVAGTPAAACVAAAVRDLPR